MEKLKEFWYSFEESTRKALCVALVIIVAFSAGNIIGSLTNVSQTPVSPDAQQTEAPATTQQTVQTAATTAPATTAASTTASAEAAATTQSSAPSTGAPAATEEIVNLFNEAINKVKTDATKVTKNYEHRKYDDVNSVVPSALSSLAKTMMDKYMGDDTEPIEYATKEDIIANYQVPGESYCSQLTAADVTSATCTDNGTEYEIVLNIAENVNPVQGSGIGAVCDIISSEQVTSNEMVSSILKEFTITYSGCIVKCKIDKATNRVTWANYLTPLTIDAKASIVVATVDAKVILSFEKDYTIAY